MSPLPFDPEIGIDSTQIMGFEQLALLSDLSLPPVAPSPLPPAVGRALRRATVADFLDPVDWSGVRPAFVSEHPRVDLPSMEVAPISPVSLADVVVSEFFNAVRWDGSAPLGLSRKAVVVATPATARGGSSAKATPNPTTVSVAKMFDDFVW